MDCNYSYDRGFSILRHLKTNRATHILLILLVVFFSLIAVSKAEGQADQIVSKMRENLSKLNSFQSDIKIDIDISYLDMPPKYGKIYYKSPGKTKVDIKGFTLLPKLGTGLFVDQILNEGEVTSIFVGEEKLDGKKHYMLKVLPNSESSDIVLTTLWVDSGDYTVTKAETTTKNMGSFKIAFKYQRVEGINMPDYMEISFDAGEFKLPKTITGDTGRSKENEKGNDKQAPGKGKIKLWYSDIKVNIPISDKVFTSS